MTLPIVEWLRQKELSGSKVVGGERVTNRRNFDGDEAADTIEELVELIKKLRPHLLLSALHSSRTRIDLLADLAHSRGSEQMAQRYQAIETKGCQFPYAVLDLQLNLIPHRSTSRDSVVATAARLNAVSA